MCVAIPCRLIDIDSSQAVGRTGLVLVGESLERHVDLTLLPEAQVGDYLIVHSGFAISKMDAPEAAEVLALLESEPGRQDSSID